jgi:hypothetical protein
MQDPNDFISDLQGSTIAQADILDKRLQDSFGEGYQTKILRKGMVLHRFIGMNKDGRMRGSFSDCWIDQPTFENMIRELQNATEQAMFTGSDERKRDAIRNQLALQTSWTTISERVKIVLKQDVIAHIGIIGPQYVSVDVDDTRSTATKRGKQNTAVSRFLEPAHGTSSSGSIKKRIELRKGGHVQYVIPRFSGLEEENGFAEVAHRAGVFKNRGLRTP